MSAGFAISGALKHKFLGRIGRLFALALAAILFGVLVGNFLNWCGTSVQWALYPFQLDYGEGVVWQQALMIMRGAGYSDVATPPFIVFHYPPGFHLMTATIVHVFGIEFLVAGRVVASLATLGTAIIIGVLVSNALRNRVARTTSLACGIFATLILFTIYPIPVWSKVMRVDMLAIFFSLLGVLLALTAPSRSIFAFLGALAFLIAMFTKQTSVAAPISMLVVMWIIRPRLAIIATLAAVAVGALVVFLIQYLTAGGFIEHTLFYNINRFSSDRLFNIVEQILAIPAYIFVLALAFTHSSFVNIRNFRRLFINFRSILRCDIYERTRFFSLIYISLTTLMLVSIMKSGASANYFSEWVFASSVGFGLWLHRPMALVLSLVDSQTTQKDSVRHGIARSTGLVLATALIIVLIVHTVVLWPIHKTNFPGEVNWKQNSELVELIRNAEKPVVSDNMVSVLRAGKEVVWEAAIFSELASIGQWDESPLIEMIDSKRFAFFITEGTKGDSLFDARYTQKVNAAIEAAYPTKRLLAGYTLRFPTQASLRECLADGGKHHRDSDQTLCKRHNVSVR